MNASPPTIDNRQESLRRMIYREFLLESNLYKQMALDELPEKLAAVLNCPTEHAVATATAHLFLEPFSFDQLKELFVIRDMEFVSRTAAAVNSELKEANRSYQDCIRSCLCYGLLGMKAHCFSALRSAAGKNDTWAKHHYLYGLLLGIDGRLDRARWELEIALEKEPYEDGKISIRRAIDLVVA